jgi:polysaccharide biosynthesis protein PslG
VEAAQLPPCGRLPLTKHMKPMKYFLRFVMVAVVAAALGGVAWYATRDQRDPFRGYAIQNPRFPTITYSVQAFLWWDAGVASVHLDWVRMMGFTHVKQIFAWDDIEPTPDVWKLDPADRILDQLEARGLQLIARLGDAPEWVHPSVSGHKDAEYIDAPPDPQFMDRWVTYCSTIATRYRGRIAAYQIWNEPNLDREWGNKPPDAAGYVELLRLCSEAIRAADPNAIIISAGLSPTGVQNDRAHRDDIYLDAMYRAGFQQYVDVVGVHTPGFTAPQVGPDDTADGRGRWAAFRRIEDLRKIMLMYGDEARQMAILEFGYTLDNRPNSDYAWFAVDEDTRARYMVEAYQYAYANWRPWVGLMSAIYISNPSWTTDNEEFWWSITYNHPDFVGGTTLPTWIALANMEKRCGDGYLPARDAGLAAPLDPMSYPICGETP